MALTERQRLRGALVVAAVLHGTLAWFSVRAPPPAPVSRYVDRGSDDLLWLDEPLAAPALESSGPAAAPSPDGPASAPTAGNDSGRRLAALARPSRAPNTGAAPSDRSDEPEVSVEAPDDNGAPGPSSTGPSLTLDQLSVGKNPFVAELANAARERPRRSSQGFRRSMAESIAKREQSLGLGAEGPILKHLEAEVRQSETTPNSRARFLASIDSKGNLIAFDLLEATSDHRPWRELAARVLKALRGTELRVPKTGRGLSMTLALDSRVQLPSGADPGLGIDVLGIPIKKGGGERSHRIAILSIVPGTKNFAIFGLGFDLVDIGANAQRVVHAHVDGLWTEDPPAGEDPPPEAAPAPPPTTNSAPGEPN